MPIDDTKFPAYIKLLLLLGGLFFVGWYAGVTVIKPWLIIMHLLFFLIPVYFFLAGLAIVFVYIIVTIFINYYFPAIEYYPRLGLIVLGIVVFFGGVIIA